MYGFVHLACDFLCCHVGRFLYFHFILLFFVFTFLSISHSFFFFSCFFFVPPFLCPLVPSALSSQSFKIPLTRTCYVLAFLEIPLERRPRLPHITIFFSRRFSTLFQLFLCLSFCFPFPISPRFFFFRFIFLRPYFFCSPASNSPGLRIAPYTKRPPVQFQSDVAPNPPIYQLFGSPVLSAFVAPTLLALSISATWNDFPFFHFPLVRSFFLTLSISLPLFYFVSLVLNVLPSSAHLIVLYVGVSGNSPMMIATPAIYNDFSLSSFPTCL